MSTRNTNETHIHETILDAIGNTPIVRLQKVGNAVSKSVNLYGKLEFMNPGGSIKDRIGWAMIEDAERRGAIKPGGVIVEGTSGNTGVGLAIAAAIKGYKCIFVLPDKMSQEKIKNLRAFGAKVVVTPTAVEPDDPRSYYQVSRRLAKETPNSIYLNQYDNLSNREAHYKTTGPEILNQMPEIDVLVAGIGTGGTICGIGKYLKEKRPGVKIVAVDPVGSIVHDMYKYGKATVAPKTYKIEGIGEDFIPQNYDFSVIDEVVQVEDKESFLMTRELLLKEGWYCGISSGSAVVGALKYIEENAKALKGKNVLVIIPDSGNRYLSKVFDDDWMREAGFLTTGGLGLVSDLLSHGKKSEIVYAKNSDKVSSIIELMKEKGISQLPVKDSAGWIKGIVTEKAVLSALYEGKVSASGAIDTLVSASIEFVKTSDTIEKASQLITSGRVPLVQDEAGQVIAILTNIDLLSYLGNKL